MKRLWGKAAARRLIISFIAFLIGMAGLAIMGKEVSACSYGGGFSPNVDSNVFTGKVLEIRRDLQVGYAIYFEVYNVEQGNVKAVHKVRTAGMEASCGFRFQVGQIYRVNASVNNLVYLWSVIHSSDQNITPEIDNRDSIQGKDLLDRFFKRNDAWLSINGEDLIAAGPFDEIYANKDNRVMVPLTDALMDRLGIEYAFNDEEEFKVTLKHKGKEYVYHVGADYVSEDKTNYFVMDTVVERYYGITFIPASQVATILGGKAIWDNWHKKLELKF